VRSKGLPRLSEWMDLVCVTGASEFRGLSSLRARKRLLAEFRRTVAPQPLLNHPPSITNYEVQQTKIALRSGALVPGSPSHRTTKPNVPSLVSPCNGASRRKKEGSPSGGLPSARASRSEGRDRRPGLAVAGESQTGEAERHHDPGRGFGDNGPNQPRNARLLELLPTGVWAVEVNRRHRFPA
jgi:hypothetical protein